MDNSLWRGLRPPNVVFNPGLEAPKSLRDFVAFVRLPPLAFDLQLRAA